MEVFRRTAGKQKTKGAGKGTQPEHDRLQVEGAESNDRERRGPIESADQAPERVGGNAIEQQSKDRDSGADEMAPRYGLQPAEQAQCHHIGRVYDGTSDQKRKHRRQAEDP